MPSPLEAAEESAPEPPENIAPQHDMTAARLMGLRDSVAVHVPLESDEDSISLQLGVPRHYELPQNWRRGTGAEALAPFDNTFNGKTVPTDVEVVDRWLAADGSHNVVIETPQGLRLCGRAQAWDPARPLVEHIMQWKICGGDFARPFTFKPRARTERIIIEPVAKDATEP